MNETELKTRFPNASPGFIKANLSNGCLAPNPKQQRDPLNEPVPKTPTHKVNVGRRLVRLTSYRSRLLDERNLFEKYFVDALVRAGILVDDAAAWCKVEVEQHRVDHAWEERTVIEVFDL